jgi:hypothetical protein
MENFTLVLRNEKVKAYRVITWIIIAAHLIIFSSFAFVTTNHRMRIELGIVISALLLFFTLSMYSRKIRHKAGLRPFFFIMILGWFATEQYWFCLIPILFFFLSTIASKKLTVRISREEIDYPSFPRKAISWNELNNVILKDGMITIDFRNNKIIQEYLDETSPVVNEKEFNEFCSKQLVHAAMNAKDQ